MARITDEIKKANVQAMKDHDANLRAIIGVLLNKFMLGSIECKAQNKEYTEADEISVLQKTLKELEEEKTAFEKAGRTEHVDELVRQMAFVEGYLPKMMSATEIHDEIAKLQDKSIPSVMKHFKSNFAGKCDMRQVQEELKKF